jgi:hypothetical protein
VYKINPRFWATRPLTDQTITWASQDIGSLFDLRTAQILASAGGVDKCKAASDKNLDIMDKIVRCVVLRRDIGRFIGTGGANIHSRVSRLVKHGCVFQFVDTKGKGSMNVYANDEAAMAVILRDLGPFL